MARKAVTDPDESAASVLDAMCMSLSKELGGDRIRSQDEINRRLVGLPVPGLAFRYLIQQDMFPLGRITVVTGLEGSCKSSLMYEIMRWHLVYGGFSLLLENETKDSPDIRQGLWSHDNDFLNTRFRSVDTRSVEEWQTALTRGIKATQDKCLLKNGPGRSVPGIFGVDSINAKGSDEDFKKIGKVGHAERGYSTVALHNTKYFQTLPSYLNDWPFSVVLIQHLKKSTDPRTGVPVRVKPGGKSIAFMETFELEMSRGRDIQNVDDGGINLTIKAWKNSLGPSRMRIDVIFRWWWYTDPETGMRQQQHVFDWDDASMHLLISQAKQRQAIWKRILDVVDLHPKLSSRRVWSRELDIPESDPLSYADAYRVIEHTRPDILAGLYDVLGIRRRRPFVRGEDILTNLDSVVLPSGPPGITMYAPPQVESASVMETLSADSTGAELPEDMEAPVDE